MKKPVLLSVALLSLLILNLQAEDQPPEKKKVVNYPGVTINLEKKELRILTEFSSNLGWRNPPIEYIIYRGREKDYETLFITKADPAHIHIGLILLGLRPGALPRVLLEQVGCPEKFPEDMPPLVDISIEWKDKNNKTKQLPLATLLRARKDDKAPKNMDFAFTGSRFTKNEKGEIVLAASLTGEVATLLYNPEALLNLPYFEPSPYTTQTGGFEIIPSELPPEFIEEKDMEDYAKGTIKRIMPIALEVTVIIRPKKP